VKFLKKVFEAAVASAHPINNTFIPIHNGMGYEKEILIRGNFIETGYLLFSFLKE